MAIVKPFHGLLPQPEKAAAVSAVPYDVVNSTEAAALAEGNPLSFLRVSRPEIEMAPGIDLHSDEVYAKALENFQRLCQSAPLIMDNERHLYLYRLTMGAHRQTGVVATFAADEYFNGIIKRHELTRQDKEDDRARHVMTLRSQTGPVFLAYRDEAKIDALMNAQLLNTPFFDFVSADGVRHELWRLSPEVSYELSKLFESVPALYIADGHHRAAAGCRAAKSCRAHNAAYAGDEEFNTFLAVAFGASQLKILPYNRLLKDLNGLTETQLLECLGERFTVEKTVQKTPPYPGAFNLYLNGQWYALSPKFDITKLDVIGQLDVSILQNEILAPLFGIDDPRTSSRIDFVGGIRGTDELEKRVKSGECAAAFSMYPTTLEQLMAVSDAGKIMPPKSTWFEPKLRDGLVCHNF